MIIYVILGLLIMVIGAYWMHIVSEYPSYVLISIGNTAYEFSFWFGVSALMVFAAIAYIVFWISKKSWASFAGSVSWIRESRGKKAERRTHSGLIHFIEGNWQAAKKDLLTAAKDVDQPLIHYLAAARSAYELGQPEETQFLLHQAEQEAPENELAIAISQARIQLADKKYEQAYATLSRIRSHAKQYPVVLDMLREAFIQLKDWAALIALLPEIKHNGNYSAEAYARLEENAYLSLLDASALDEDKNKTEEVWKNIPKVIKKNPRVVGLYCTYLHRNARDDEAAKLIQTTLKHDWYDGLVELYGKLKVEDTKHQLTTAESWLKAHTDDASLHFALGKICMRNSLWGKARSYFEQSIKLNARPEVYAELGALMAQLGEHEKSAQLYKTGLQLVSS